MGRALTGLFRNEVGESDDQAAAQVVADVAIKAVVGMTDELSGRIEFTGGERGAGRGVDEHGDARVAPLAMQFIEGCTVHGDLSRDEVSVRRSLHSL